MHQGMLSRSLAMQPQIQPITHLRQPRIISKTMTPPIIVMAAARVLVLAVV